MFVDKATTTVKAGDGGNGTVSFRHEKFVDKGGPDGGDGGDGGSVIFVASRNENTLANFRFQKELNAKDGETGGKRRRHGKNGNDLVVKVPVGTAIVSMDGEVIADFTVDDQQAVIAKGGRGGFGNAHFVSSRRQTPRIAEKGEKGEMLEAQLELKLIADVGLIGLPNAGKSTLLSVVSNAQPEIADYSFTTLTPNLGVVDVDNKDTILFADIPGLIEGAATGKGLGDEFLRHVERTAVLVHLVDAYQENVAEAYRIIQGELSAYKVDLSSRPQIMVLTKIEGLEPAVVTKQMANLKKVAPKGTLIMAISSKSMVGVPELLRKVVVMVKSERSKQEAALADNELESDIPILTLPGSSQDETWSVTKDEDGSFVVVGAKIERFASRTHFDNEEGVQRLRSIMQKMGITHDLVRKGAKAGDSVHIGHEGELTY